MIHEDTYVDIRNATAADVPEMISMMSQSIEDAALVPRSREDLFSNLTDYFVLTVDSHVVGCVAVHLLDDNNCELACLYVKKEHSGQGYGKELVRFASDETRRRGASRLIALSTQAAGFFESEGFVASSKEQLPQERVISYEKAARNAKILIKSSL